MALVLLNIYSVLRLLQWLHFLCRQDTVSAEEQCINSLSRILQVSPAADSVTAGTADIIQHLQGYNLLI